MRKILLGLLILLFIFTPTANSTSHLDGRIIILDPGHGGSDPGSTSCQGLTEADANLEIALLLKTKLEQSGADVRMTRETDETLSNKDRYDFANNNNGEILVSVHLNGSTNPDTNGTQGLYGKKNKDQKFTQVLHQRLASELGVPDLGITNFASGVLLKSNMPATIQETVFISNSDECAKLTNGTGVRQQEIADSLYNGISDWFSQPPPSDGDSGGGPPPGKGKPQK
ncbi:MAG: N-acetylmuramoyl-L-alanine amidase [Candidatus Levybacteria bacterium]|nr:N-acetylmuramoyl-L-alanine amidase [Candidatus Levybacteria bacterium]